MALAKRELVGRGHGLDAAGGSAGRSGGAHPADAGAGRLQRQPGGAASGAVLGPARLPVGSAVQFEVRNREATPIHMSLLVIDPTGEMTVIFPNNWTADAEATRVAAGASLLVPDPGRDGFRLVTQEPRGPVEVLIVASFQPIHQALRGLQAIAGRTGQTRGPVTLAEPVAAVEELLRDLTAGPAATRGLAVEKRGLDSTQIATLSLSFEVI